MTRWFTLTATATVISISLCQSRLLAGELDIGVVEPIGKVGDIGKVEPIDKVVDGRGPTAGTRPLADTGYIVCWNWNLAREPKWRCTQQLADLPQAREFSNYQNGRYELGQSFFLPVYKRDWDDPASRKVVMERVQKGAIPKAIERVAGRENQPGRNPQRAALIRKQIQFVQPEWVDVKPVLPKEVKASDTPVSKKVGYDDEAVVSVRGLPVISGRWKHISERGIGYDIYDFKLDGKVSIPSPPSRFSPTEGIFRVGSWRTKDSETIIVSFPESGAYSGYKAAWTGELKILSPATIEIEFGRYTGGTITYLQKK
jgi:hypothetical protein